MTATPEVDIRFGVLGNAKTYQGGGWSNPEEGFTWALGMSASLHILLPKQTKRYLVILEARPFLHPSHRNSQVLVVVANGEELGRYRFNQKFKKVIRLEVHPGRNRQIHLELLQTEADSPSNYGSSDRRQLGFAWSRVRFIAAIPPRYGSDTPRDFCDLILTEPLRTDVAAIVENALLVSLSNGALAEADTIINQHYPAHKVSIRYDADLPDDLSLVRCGLDVDGGWTFGFPLSWRGRDTSQPACLMIAWHLIASLPLFLTYTDNYRFEGSTILSLGDEAHARGLSFCTNTSESLLIPDPYFMRSRGYEQLKHDLAIHEMPFRNRKPFALWRGSSTGYYKPGELLELERVRLCLFAKVNDTLLDVGISAFVQTDSEELKQLGQLDILKAYVPSTRLPEWMFHIDVDGNTSSWPGLFQKLASGGVVVKIESKAGWRQWYYDRLIPFVNFIPVSNDMQNLIPALKSLSSDMVRATAIATSGRLLTLVMSYESEVFLAMSVLEEAMMLEVLLNEPEP